MEITKSVPVPKSTRGRKPKYPFANMRKGESFEVPSDDVKRVQSAASHHGRRHGTSFTVQEVKGVYRCWRIG